MKKSSVVGRWPLAVGLGLGMMCAFEVPAAHAGYWEFVPRSETGELSTGTVKFIYSWQDYPGDSLDRYIDEYPVYSDVSPDGRANGGIGSGFEAMGGPGESSVEGLQFKVQLRYVPDDADDVPQGPVYVKVVLQGSAYAEDGVYGGTRNTSKEHASVTVTPPGNIVPGSLILNSHSHPYWTSKSETSTFYVKVEPDDASNPVDVGGATVKGSLDGDRFTDDDEPMFGMGSASASFIGEIKDFSLGISRVGAPSPKKMSAPDFDANRDEYIDADGVRHGHTTYSYDEIYTLGSPTHHSNVQGFSANLNLPSGVTGQWQWSPSSDDDSQQSHSQEMPYGSANVEVTPGLPPSRSWAGTPTGTQEKIVSYSFDSSVGINLDAQYQLTLHDEWEVKEQIGTTDPQAVVSTWYPFPAWTANAIPPSPAPNPAPIQTKYGVSYSSSVTQEYKRTVSKGSSAAVNAGIDAAKLSPWLANKGITLGATGEASIAVASEAVTTSTNSQSLTYTVEQQATIMPGWEARPSIEILAKREQFKLWHWGPSGFLSDNVLTVDTTDDTPYRPIWEYREITSSGGGEGG